MSAIYLNNCTMAFVPTATTTTTTTKKEKGMKSHSVCTVWTYRALRIAGVYLIIMMALNITLC